MCGILFCLEHAAQAPDTSTWDDVFASLKNANAARGPDAQDTVCESFGDLRLTFVGSELRLRGDGYVAQPHRDPQGNVLCWNGEIFEGLQVLPEENDGAKLFEALQRTQTPEDIRDILSSIEGPYAIVYYQASSRTIFFGRDPLGRRSLLISKPTSTSPRLVLTSVSVGPKPEYSLDELSTEEFFYLDLASLAGHDLVNDYASSVTAVPRENPSQPKPYARLPPVTRTIPADPPLFTLDNPPEHFALVVDELIAHLDDSVRLRVVNIPQKLEDRGKARVAVLFSGGIDCTVLAYLADRHLDPTEPIDLLNVAFENPRKLRAKMSGDTGRPSGKERKENTEGGAVFSSIDPNYDVPDRLTGLQELEELRKLSPHRIWNFVEIDVPYDEYQATRSAIEDIMYPCRTVMDLSLAASLYFASRGNGRVRDPITSEPVPYQSSTRVLLNGLGSDELLGGYGRFHTRFKAGGWQAIVDELQLELDRLPTRNLGRDDRVISSHGKETRHPFLSLSLVAFLSRLPVHMKLDPRMEAGIGEKVLLRLAARKLGLVEASVRKKRAMQFGSHSARMTTGDEYKKGDLLLRSSTE